MDKRFVEEVLQPYLRELYRDLQIRSNHDEHVDKVTFIEYTKLPGIINDRLYTMFATDDIDSESTSITPQRKKESSPQQLSENF